jgi:hypothetical protein
VAAIEIATSKSEEDAMPLHHAAPAKSNEKGLCLIMELKRRSNSSVLHVHKPYWTRTLDLLIH